MSTAAVQAPVQPVELGAVAGYGESNESMEKIEASPLPSPQSTLQPTPTKVYSDSESTRGRAQSTSSLGGNKPIPANRQADFEKLFGQQLPKPKGEETPADFLTVLQTQSADLQASVLLHGRLYLTRYHLCFRSNIMGYVTERVHDLRDIVWVERSTTAKWIQNAVSVGVDTELDDKVIGYGSMADREAMYTGLMDVWKERAPERYSQFLERRETKSAMDADLAGAATRHRSATTATKSGVPHDIETTGRHRSATATAKLGQDKPTTKTEAGITEEEEHEDDQDESQDTEAKETECCGEHFDEVALDTTLPVEIDQLFELMYHNEEFGQDFFKNKQKLTDTSDWTEKNGAKERSLKYVMHMNNYIGPKKSDCIGSERVEVEKPNEVYEIVSSTQTPDVPSGKSFKIHTRTCLTRTVDNGTPSTRMYCTTQCDWSASSMLKSTITPAVIKGQKEYHQSWLGALKEWIDAHPEDFKSTSPSNSAGSSGKAEKPESNTPRQTANGAKVVPLDSKSDVIPERSTAPIDTHVVDPASAIQESTDITKNQPMMAILLVCLLSIALNVYLVSK